MKKIQNYLTRPEQLRKKLENPAFRHDFMQWSKSHLCQPQNGRQRNNSKSPHERSRSNLSGALNNKNNHSISFNSQINQSHNQSYNSHSRSKQNITPNYLYNNGRQQTNSLSKKNLKKPVSESKPIKNQNSKVKTRKPLPSQSKSHSFLHIYRPGDDHSSRMNYSSLRKSNHSQQNNRIQKQGSSRPSSISNSNLLKDKKKTNKISPKGAPINNKKIQFKYSYRTRQGCLATNPNKTNQDRLLIKTSVNSSKHNIFAVADGHGAHGHHVAECIVSNMSSMLQKQLKNNSFQQDLKHNKQNQPETFLPSIYNKIQKILSESSQINAQCSGSTLVTVSMENQSITCANVGDSRAILARQVDKKSWEVIYLSQDQKPCVQAQKKRILKYGGRIHALKDERGEQMGPLRVWLPNQNIQGLAMSRSLGDNVSKPYGVTHRPEIVKIPTDKRDKFILIASDGVWQFISNQEVLQLIVPFYRQKKLQQACDALLKLSYDRWTVQDTSVVDDITFILIFLQN